ncbi:MAG: LacI family DNA-binding transcriptional regulator [Verrucomicrobiota bacterium]
MKQPTLREIAKACGVHLSTVSRALSRNHSIPAPTRRRILKQAKAMGWKPNPFASAYVAHVRSTRRPRYQATLGFVVPYGRAGHPLYVHRLCVKAARQRAESLGFGLEEFWLGDYGHDFTQFEKLLKNRGIPGFIFNPRELTPEALRGMDWSAFAVATWGARLPELPLHHAACHHVHGVRLMVDRLRQLGYRRVAMILSRQQDYLADYAYFAAFDALAPDWPRPGWLRSLRLESWDSSPAQDERIRRWIERHEPEVIIGEGNVWHVLGLMGVRVPAEMAFLTPFWSKPWKHIGGLYQRIELTGANLVDLVSGQIFRNERGIPTAQKYMLNEGVWIDGPSVPPNAKRDGAEALPMGHPKKEA